MKNVRSSQPCISMNFCTESVKHKFFHVRIVNLVLTTTYYTFNAKFYQQTAGVKIAAEIYIQAREKTAIFMTLYPPKVWKQFSDGVCSILKSTHLKNFFHHI